MKHEHAIAVFRRSLGLFLLSAGGAQAQTIEFVPPAYPPGISTEFGRFVAGLRDVDGDGWGDLAIDDTGGTVIGDNRQGRVYLYSGRTHALLGTLRSTRPVSWGGYFARTMCSLGDVDGDQRDDIAVAESLAADPGVPLGGSRVHVFSGATTDALYSLESGYQSSFFTFGYALSRVPDIDNDGVDDLLVGSPYEPDGGIVYVYSGATGENLLTLHSPSLCCQFGEYVAGAPDLDADGRGDIVVTSSHEPIEPGSPIRGVVYVMSGATGSVVHRIIAQSSSVAAVTDLDGDGVGDILIAWHFGNESGTPDGTGIVRVFSGATGEQIRVLHCPDGPISGNFGSAVTVVPDLDGDGRPEILVGMIGFPSAGLGGSGIAYLFSGESGTLLRRLTSLHPQGLGFFGLEVAAVPDINADGRAELLVGAPEESFDLGNSRGRAYLFLSCPADMNADGLATSQDFFDFLTALFTDSARADFNHDGTINTQDFFDFLTAFFAGC